MSPIKNVIPLLLATLLLAGCDSTPYAPIPETAEILADCCRQVHEFLEAAQKSKSVDQIKSDLDLKLEGLQAQSEQFGEQLTDLFNAADQLRDKLDSVKDLNAAKPLLEEFKTQVEGICPQP